MNYENNIKLQLYYTTNSNLSQFIGNCGFIDVNEKGGYDFVMDNGLTISTSAILPGSTLGNLAHPSCKEFSFSTKDGVMYIFRCLDRESLYEWR